MHLKDDIEAEAGSCDSHEKEGSSTPPAMFVRDVEDGTLHMTISELNQ